VSHDHAQWAERFAYLFAGVAAVSISQAAYALTIVATLLSIMLAGFKLHDRIRYGPARGRE
jgi:methyl coenzyme M reductase subunit D